MATEPVKSGIRMRTRVLQNTAAQLGGRGISIVLSAGASILLARYLGSERLGEFGAIYAYLGLFTWMTTLGMEPILIREISIERESASSLLHTTVVLATFCCAGTLLAAFLVAPWAGFTGSLRTLLILAGLEFALTPFRLPAIIFQVDMRQWYPATINVVRQFVWFGIVVVLWLLGASLLYVILGRLFAAMLETSLTWAYSRKFLSGERKFLSARIRKILSHSVPIAFTSLLSMVYLRIDQVMLHKMVSDSVLGQYVAAVKISELFEMLPSALIVALAPILAVSAAEPERFQSYTDRAFRYFMVVAAGLCVVMSSGAAVVVRVFYGKQFLLAAPLLAVLIWSEVAVFFGTVVYNVLIAQSKQRLLPVSALVGAAVNVILNFVLIPRYAAAGAAWATLISYTVALMALLLVFKETRSVTWRGLQFALPSTALALFAVTCASLVSASGVARILIASSLFALSIWTTKLINRSDVTEMLVAISSSLRRNDVRH